ncbi:MAG: hypothetical protein A3H94_00350 [Acidobacteria bacterium RIFCSPLOWO2_02_FULL_60_20]|nr:MAG: hypothetical protein A3H94_00350 [Acidobacteria bacterium RIFCSPLOWO2_02_FULL_60_20]
MHRIEPAFHRRWDMQAGGGPLRKNELSSKQGRCTTGEGDQEDILRYVRSVHDNGWADFPA